MNNFNSTVNWLSDDIERHYAAIETLDMFLRQAIRAWPEDKIDDIMSFHIIPHRGQLHVGCDIEIELASLYGECILVTLTGSEYRELQRRLRSL